MVVCCCPSWKAQLLAWTVGLPSGQARQNEQSRLTAEQPSHLNESNRGLTESATYDSILEGAQQFQKQTKEHSEFASPSAYRDRAHQHERDDLTRACPNTAGEKGGLDTFKKFQEDTSYL